MFEDWITIQEPAFEIAFPRQPLHFVVPCPDGAGNLIASHCYLLEPEGNSDLNFLYNLTYIDYPGMDIHHDHFPLKVKYFLDSLVNSVVGGIYTGELRRILSTARPGYAGRMIDVAALGGQFVYKIHCLLSGTRIYTIQTLTHQQWAENDKVKKFIASFAVRDNVQLQVS